MLLAHSTSADEVRLGRSTKRRLESKEPWSYNPMRKNIRLAELLMGVEGLAILRHLLRGEDEQIAARVEELAKLCTDHDEDSVAGGFPLPEMDYRSGYAAWSETYDRPGNPLIAIEEPEIRSIFDALPLGFAIDVACGTGRHATYLSAKGHDVVGVDASREMLARARSNAPTVPLLEGDVRALPVADEIADLAVCALALAHIEELTPAVLELARVTHRGGHIVLSDIHPAAVLLMGGAAFFQTSDRAFAFVRDFLHLHSDYILAFSEAGLRIEDCREVRIKEGHLPLHVFSYPSIPEATKDAYLGLPFALIWHLTRP